MRLSVQGKFAALISCAVILATVSLSIHNVVMWKRDEVTELEQKAETLAHSMATNSEQGVLFADIPQLTFLAKAIAEDVDTNYVVIQDEKGKPLVDIHREPRLPDPESMAEKTVARERRGDEELVFVYFKSKGGVPALEVRHPVSTRYVTRHFEELEALWEQDTSLRAQGRKSVIGEVRIGLSMERAFAELQAIRRHSMLLTSGMILLGILLSLPVARVVTGPIRELVGATQAIAKGDLTRRVSVRTRDEIGELALSFNQMVEDLRRSRDQIEEHRRTLARKVEERTAELSAANERLQRELAMRERAEREIRTYAAKLELSNRELEQFAFLASHDLREPLRKIQTFGERLVARCGQSLGEQGRDYLIRMQNASQRMQDLIEGLLSYSRVTTKARPFEPVDLSHVIREVLSDLEVSIEQENGRVEVGELPTIEADPLQMRELLQNLLTNALKFHRDGEAPLVKVSSRLPQPGVAEKNGVPACQIFVEDNGIGFDEKYMDRIFGIFQRLHGRTEYKGTGIGLAVCRKIVERHGGTLTAKSRPGQGTTFIVTLPINHPEGGSDQCGNPQHPSPS